MNRVFVEREEGGWNDSPSTPDRQTYSWHVEPEWVERHRDGEVSDEALLDRVNKTLEGPHAYDPDGDHHG